MEEIVRGSLARGVRPCCVLAFASRAAAPTRLWNTRFGGSEGGGIHTSAGPALFQPRKISPQCMQRSRRKHWFFQAFLQHVYVILREKRTLLLTWPVASCCISFDFADEHKVLLLWAVKHPWVAAWKSPQVPSPSSPSLLHLPKGTGGRWAGKWKPLRRWEEAQLKEAEVEAWPGKGEYGGRNMRGKGKGFGKGKREEVEIRNDPSSSAGSPGRALYLSLWPYAVLPRYSESGCVV